MQCPRMTFSLAKCAVIAATLSACQADAQRRPSPLPEGRLGHPIGTYLRLEGTRHESGKVSGCLMLVDRVDGAPLTSAITISIENVLLPPASRCRLAGYESGRWIGVPPAVERAEGLLPQQADWQFERFFVVTSAEEPEALAEQFRRPRLVR